MKAFIYIVTGIVARCGEDETTFAWVTDVLVGVGEQLTINKIAAVPAASESYKTVECFEVLAEAR